MQRNGKRGGHAIGGGDTDSATLKTGFVAGILFLIGIMVMGMIAGMVMTAGVSVIA